MREWMALTFIVLGSGCDPSGPAPAVVSVDQLVSRVPAGPDTTAATGVMAWEVHQASGDRLAVVAIDGAGRRLDALQVTRAEDVLVITADSGRLSLDSDGQVLEDGLGPRGRTMLARLSLDLQAEPIPHGALTCALSVLTIIGASAACGAVPGIACLGLPGAFCNASKECGNNVCGL